MLKASKASLKREIKSLKSELGVLHAKNETNVKDWGEEKMAIMAQHEEDLKKKENLIEQREKKLIRIRNP